MRFFLFRRSMSMLALALAAGLCSAWAARQYLQEKTSTIAAQARVPVATRIVAGENLPAGTPLQVEHLAARDLPVACAASDSFPPAALHALQGMVLTTSVQAGDAILPAHLEDGRAAALSSQLSSGRRAVTLPVDAINSQSGLLQPGDLIDLYVSFDHQRRRMTAPLLQSVLVLATGASTDVHGHGAGQDYSTITLEAAPEDAIKLVAARESGVITAVLRAPQDSGATHVAVRGDLAGLLGVGRPPASAPARPRVIYGNQAVRNLPALVAPLPDAAQSTGLVQLPYVPALSSQWMPPAVQTHTAGQLSSVTPDALMHGNQEDSVAAD